MLFRLCDIDAAFRRAIGEGPLLESDCAPTSPTT